MTPSPNRADESLRATEWARQDFLPKPPPDNDNDDFTLPIRPPPATSAAETEAEAETRRPFLRTAAPAGGFAAFWRRFEPDMSIEDEAVRHAVAALSSARQRHRAAVAGGPGLPGLGMHDLDVLTMQQYDLAVSCLARRPWDPSSASLRSTLVCCLAFVCLEVLRGDRAAAVTHLANGLRILESVEDRGLSLVWGDSGDVYQPDPPRPEDEDDIRDLLWLFARLEVGAVLFAGGVRPILSLRVLEQQRRLGSYSGVENFDSLAAAHAEVCNHVRMVLAWLWQTRERYGDVVFWSDHDNERQHSALKDGGQRVIRLYQQFVAAPRLANLEHLSTQADLLYFNTAELLLESTTGVETTPFGDTVPAAEPSARSERLAREMVLLASQILSLLSQMCQQDLVVSSNVDIIGPLYIAAISSEDTALQEKALVLMRRADTNDGFWAGPTLQQLVERVVDVVKERHSMVGGQPLGRLVLGRGDSLYQKLAKLGSTEV